MDSILSEEGGDDPVHARLLPEEYLAVALFIGATVLAGAQVTLRELFNIGLPWSTETIVTMMIWSVYFGASGVTARRRHVRMDLLATLAPPRAGALMEIAASTCTLLYIAAIAVLSWRFFAFVFHSGELDPSTGLPGWFLVVGFPLGLTVAAYRAAGELRGRVRRFGQLL
jgi:TRAP-type C4-dicarboxylate transport system permease small subunit